jgi:hypothetical protein
LCGCLTWRWSRSRGGRPRLVCGRCLSDGLLPRGCLGRRRVPDGRLPDRGLRSRSLRLGSWSLLRRWFRCGPLLRWLLLYRRCWACSRFRCRRLRGGIALLRRRVLAGRSHRRVGWGQRYRFGWRRHGRVRRAGLRRDRNLPRRRIGASSRRIVGRYGLQLSPRVCDRGRCVDGHR